MKRILCLLLSAMIIISSMGITVFADNSHWSYDYIKGMLESGVVTGDQNGNLNLDNLITRAEFAKTVNKYFGYTVKADTGFNDVASGAWYYDDMLIAKGTGYMIGDANGNATPDASITRAEVFVIIARILGLADEATVDFADSADIPDWAKGKIAALKKAGKITGYEDGTIRANGNITRAEAFVTIAKNERAALPSDTTTEGMGNTSSMVQGVGNSVTTRPSGGGGGGGSSSGGSGSGSGNGGSISGTPDDKIEMNGFDAEKMTVQILSAPSGSKFTADFVIDGKTYTKELTATYNSTSSEPYYTVDFGSALKEIVAEIGVDGKAVEMTIKVLDSSGTQIGSVSKKFEADVLVDKGNFNKDTLVLKLNAASGTTFEASFVVAGETYTKAIPATENNGEYTLNLYDYAKAVADERKTDDEEFTVTVNAKDANGKFAGSSNAYSFVMDLRPDITNFVGGVNPDTGIYEYTWDALSEATGYIITVYKDETLETIDRYATVFCNGIPYQPSYDGVTYTPIVVPSNSLTVNFDLNTYSAGDSYYISVAPKFGDIMGAAKAENAKKVIVGFSGGEGTIASPFIITTADQFSAVFGNGSKNQANLFDKHFYLAKDIDLSTANVKFLPNITTDFTGSLKGVKSMDDFTLEKRTINLGTVESAGKVSNASSPALSAGGIFYQSTGSTISHLVLKGNFKTEVSGSYTKAGGFIGFANKANISNIDNYITFSVQAAENGGIIGNATASNISNCTNYADLSATAGSIGGIVGQLASNSSTLTNCANYGEISNSVASGYTAGIVASTYGKIFNSFNVGKINGKYASGGIAGYNCTANNVIENCWNAGEIISTDKNNAKAGSGGILGSNYSAVPSRVANIKNCFNLGKLTGYRVGSTTANLYSASSTITNFIELGNPDAPLYNDGYAAPTSQKVTSAYTIGAENGLTAELILEAVKNDPNFANWVIVGDYQYPQPKALVDAGMGRTESFTPATIVIDLRTPFEKYDVKGSGTEADPYIVDNGAKFVGLFGSELNTKDVESVYGSENTKVYYMQTADIDLGTNFVAQPDCKFYGSYTTKDGKALKINLDVNSGAQYTALFSHLYGEVSNITVTGTITSSASYTAAIAARGYEGSKITNCTNNAEINGNKYVAGIMAAGVSAITNCSNNGAITGSAVLGGIIAELTDNVTTVDTPVVISGCINTGNVKSTLVASAMTSVLLGGIVGKVTEAASKIVNSHNTGNITANITNTQGIGGIVGWLEESRVEFCSNAGTVGGARRAGGIAGFEVVSEYGANDGEIEVDTKHLGIHNSYNVGDVTVSGSDVGGITGFFWAYVNIAVVSSNNFNAGSVTINGSKTANCGSFVGNFYEQNAGTIVNYAIQGFYDTTGTKAIGVKGRKESDGYLSNPVCYNTYILGGTDLIYGETAIDDAGLKALTSTDDIFKKTSVWENSTNMHPYPQLVGNTYVLVAYTPENLEVVVENNKAILKWTAIQDADSYRVYIDGEKVAENLTGKTYEITKLGNSSIIQVGAVKDGVEYLSEKLAENLAYYVPENLRTLFKDNKIMLEWTTEMDADSYKVFIDDIEVANNLTVKEFEIDTANTKIKIQVIAVKDGVEYASSVLNANLEFAGGTGTAGDPYLVATLAQFNSINNYLSAHFKQIADIGTVTTPIGSADKKFTGSYDGNGYEIDVYLVCEDSTTKAVGLFAHLSSGTIKNVTTTGSVYLGKSYKGDKSYGNAVIVAHVTGTPKAKSYVTNCINKANFTSESTNSGVLTQIGGIVGRGFTSDLEITGCLNYGNIKTTSRAAGIAGVINAGTKLDNCANFGKIDGAAAAAGIITWSYGNISNCYNMGEIITGSAGQAAGIATLQNNDPLISNCFNAGKVSGSSNVAAIAVTQKGTKKVDNVNVFAPENVYRIENCYNTVDGLPIVVDLAAAERASAGYIYSHTNTYNVTASDTFLGVTTTTLEALKNGEVTISGFEIVTDSLYPYLQITTNKVPADYVPGQPDIPVTPAELVSISLERDTFEVEGGVEVTEELVKSNIGNVTATFDDDSTLIISTGYSVSIDTVNKKITITYQGKVAYATYTVKSVAPEAGSIVITNADDFIAYFSDDSATQAENFDKTFYLAADIDLTGKNFVPNKTTVFTGKLMGIESETNAAPVKRKINLGSVTPTGKTRVSTTLTEYDCGGVFAMAEGADFSYLIMEGTVASNPGTELLEGTTKLSGSTGALVGYGKAGTVFSNIDNYATVTGLQRTGGIVGYLHGEGSSATNLRNFGTISGTSDGVGGIIGSEMNTDGVSSLYNKGSVTSTIHAGGICGMSYKAMTNCVNVGTVTSTSTNTGHGAGGIVGYVAQKGQVISSCYNAGAVAGASVGGIVGAGYGSSGGRAFTVKDCYNIGILTGSVNTGAAIGNAQKNNVTVTNYYDLTNENAKVVGAINSANTATVNTSYVIGGTVTKDTIKALSFTNWKISGNFEYPQPNGLFEVGLAYDKSFDGNSGSEGEGGETPDLSTPQGQIGIIGSGTEADPFIIDTPDKLRFIFGTTHTDDLDAVMGTQGNPVYYLQTADIDLEANFAVKTGSVFYGVYRGGEKNGTTINYSKKNININKADATWTAKNVALFPMVAGEVSYIKATGGMKTTGDYFGSIVGTLKPGGKITNCESTVNLVGSGSYVGGIVGYVEKNTAGDSLVSDCTFQGAISGKNYVGGISGSARGATIKNCVNSADIIIGGKYVAGIVGHISEVKTSVINCTNNGDITYDFTGDESTIVPVKSNATENVYQDIGGIIGIAGIDVEIDGCHNTGDITVDGYYKDSNNTYGFTQNVGGIIGYLSISTAVDNATISNCSNTGDIVITALVESKKGPRYAGGIAGRSWGGATATLSITGCYNSGNISGANNYSAGIIGNIYRPSSAPVTVSDCFNIGSIQKNSNYDSAIVGYLWDKAAGYTAPMTVKNCYSVTCEKIVGSIYTNCTTTTVENCYMYTEDTLAAETGVTTVSSATELCNLITEDKLSSDIWQVSETANIPEIKLNLYKGAKPDINAGSGSGSGDGSNTPDTPADPNAIAGTGTASDPYILDTAEKFVSIFGADNTDTSKLTSDYVYAVTQDIILPETYVPNPVGFKGTLKGISTGTEKISINIGDVTGREGSSHRTAGSGDTATYKPSVGGLIDGTSGNSTFSNFALYGTLNSSVETVGALVGNTLTGTITMSNIDNYVTITGSSKHTGGLVGLNGAATITNCHNYAPITSGSTAGGLVGTNQSNKMTMTGCSNGVDAVITGQYAGGLVGSLYGTIEKSYNLAAVNATLLAGGITGRAFYNGGTAKVLVCFNKGNVAINGANANTAAGGIVGGTDFAANKKRNVLIENCYNLGEVTKAAETESAIGAAIGNPVAGTCTITNFYDATNKDMPLFGEESLDTTNSAYTNAYIYGEATSDVTGLSYVSLDDIKALDLGSAWTVKAGYDYPQLVNCPHVD